MTTVKTIIECDICHKEVDKKDLYVPLQKDDCDVELEAKFSFNARENDMPVVLRLLQQIKFKENINIPFKLVAKRHIDICKSCVEKEMDRISDACDHKNVTFSDDAFKNLKNDIIYNPEDKILKYINSAGIKCIMCDRYLSDIPEEECTDDLVKDLIVFRCKDDNYNIVCPHCARDTKQTISLGEKLANALKEHGWKLNWIFNSDSNNF